MFVQLNPVSAMKNFMHIHEEASMIFQFWTKINFQ